MNTKRKAQIVGLTLLALALLISFEQWLSWGVFFEIEDIHHELFIAMFAFGGGILYYFGGKKS